MCFGGTMVFIAQLMSICTLHFFEDIPAISTEVLKGSS